MWPLKPIRDFGEIFDGPHATPKFTDKGPVFLGISSLNQGRLNLNGTRHLSEENYHIWTRRIKPRPGDIVFSYETKIGEAAIIPENLVCCLGRRLGLIRVNERKCDPAYFLYQYLSPQYQNFLSSQTVHGATVDRLLIKDFPNFLFPLPPLPEQREIAAILGALDDKIENNRKTAATLEEMARALYRSWFVNFDPVHARAEGRAPAHMDAATAALFPDRFGEDGLPEGWITSTIGSVANIVGGSTPSTKNDIFWSEGCHAWATPKDLSKLNQLFLFDTERNITDTGLEKITSGLSPAGTVLLSSRAPIGYLALSAIPIAINQGFIAIRETEYLSAIEAYFWCMENMDLIKSNANGSTFQEISKKNFRPLIYRLAPASIRNAFCKRANPLFARIKLANQQSQTLVTLRDTLLPRLMSGELRVSVAKEMVEEASS